MVFRHEIRPQTGPWCPSWAISAEAIRPGLKTGRTSRDPLINRSRLETALRQLDAWLLDRAFLEADGRRGNPVAAAGSQARVCSACYHLTAELPIG